MKPKDLKTKHKVGNYIYIRQIGPITSEYAIRRVKIDEIIITVKEKTVEIHYDVGEELYPEDRTSATIEEAEGHALAELAAYKLKGGDTAREENSKSTAKATRVPLAKIHPGRKRRHTKVTPDSSVCGCCECFPCICEDEEDEDDDDDL